MGQASQGAIRKVTALGLAEQGKEAAATKIQSVHRGNTGRVNAAEQKRKVQRQVEEEEELRAKELERRIAVVMERAQCDAHQAESVLAKHDGHVGLAIMTINSSCTS